jgi:hypothetical protein
MVRRRSGWYLGEGFHGEVAMGAPCLFTRHSHGARDHRSQRYTDTQACVQCVAELVRPTLNLDVNAVLRSYQLHYLEFWALVNVRGPDDCWEHRNRVLDYGRSSWSLSVRRPTWLTGGHTRIAPYRVASWFSWGDTGALEVKPVCDNRACCNPLHLRVVHVPHFHRAATIDRVDLCLRVQQHQSHIDKLLQRKAASLLDRVAPERINRIAAVAE